MGIFVGASENAFLKPIETKARKIVAQYKGNVPADIKHKATAQVPFKDHFAKSIEAAQIEYKKNPLKFHFNNLISAISKAIKSFQ
jgi:hypothetical protein